MDFTNFNSVQLNTSLQNVRTRKFIIGTLSETGVFSVSPNPVGHTTRALADQEAERLAVKNPGTAYIVMQLTGGRVVPKVIGVTEF